MADYGFNLRASSGFVTDGANTTYVVGDVYPTTRNGITFGWINALADEARDRRTDVDVRLAGFNGHYNNSGTTNDFRVDLPNTGAWDIRLGAADYGQSGVQIELLDNTTSIIVIGGSGFTSSYTSIPDATNTVRTSDTDWATNNAINTHTFTSTTFLARCGSSGAINESILSHIFLSSSGGGGSAIKTKKGVAIASVKTFKSLAIASVKTDKGLA